MKLIKYFVLLLFLLILILMVYILYTAKIKEKEKVIIDNIELDLNYNREVKDSIIYNIHYQDSIVKVIDYEFEIKKEKINSLNDSSTIKLFYELVAGE